MKITLDIPKYTTCAFFNYVYYGDGAYMSMGVKSLDSDDLVDGNVIKVDPKGENDWGE